MFGSSSTTSSRASDCARSSVIDVFMIFIIAPFAEGNLNVSSGTAAVFPAYAPRRLRRSRRCALIRFRIVERGRAVVHSQLGVGAPRVILDRFLCQEQVG